MPSYIPEYCIFHNHIEGPIAGPWPAHLRPEPLPDVELHELFGVELTKKGEAYAESFKDTGSVFSVQIDKNDRAAISYTIERLLNALDELDADPDLEPNLGWCENAGKGIVEAQSDDDREDVCEDEGAGDDCEPDAPDGPGFIWGGGEDDPRAQRHAGRERRP